jgi:hypothetical protein
MTAITLTLTDAAIRALPDFKLHDRRRNEYVSGCPFCGDGEDRFHYWPTEGNFWCRQCDTKGFIDQEAELDPVRLTEFENERERRERQRREEERRAAERIRSLSSRAEYYHSQLTPEARAWWHSQGIDDATIDRYQLGYRPAGALEYGWRRETASYTIPNYRAGELVDIRHRLAKDINGKYRPEFTGLKQQLFNVDRLARTDGLMDAGEAVLVEGAKKAIVLDQAGFTVVSVPGKTLGEAVLADLRRVLTQYGIHRLFIALDPDAVDEARALALQLGYSGLEAIVSSHRLTGKPDDMLVNGQVTPAELYATLSPRQSEIRARREDGREAATARQAQREEAKEARAAELEARWQAGNVIPFEGEVPDPDHLEYKRNQFTNAQKWADYCRAHWPDIDAEEQKRIKLAENREEKIRGCGQYRRLTLPTGEVVTKRWTCGLCDECQKRNVHTLRRALNELQGIPPENHGPLLTADLIAELPVDDAPRENAPPLPQVKGDLTLVTVHSHEERLQLARELRRAGIAYRAQPIEWDGQVLVDVLVNDDRGEPLVFLTDGRLAAWARGVEGKRASGGLLPSMDKLKQRYREALPFEVVMPELDDDGKPVDEDIFALDLPDVGTTAILPTVLVDFDVYDAGTLQAALLKINQEQKRILGWRGEVSNSGYTQKKFYTRYSTLPALLERFNARQEQIRRKKSPD